MMNLNINYDEWRPWEQNASPMLLMLTLNAGMKDLRGYFGTALWTSVIIFEDNQAKWLFRPKELKLLGQKMIDFLMCPPFRVAFLTGYEKTEQSLMEEAQEIQFDVDFGALNDQELIALFEHLSHTYYRWYKHGWFCEPVQFQAQDILTLFLEKAKASDPALDVAKAIQALFAIDQGSFAVDILQHLNGCAKALAEVLKNDTLANAVERIRGEPEFPARAAEMILSATKANGGDASIKAFIDKINEHSSMFYWKRNNYFSTKFLSSRDVLEELLASDAFQVGDPSSSIETELLDARENKRRLLAEKASLVNTLPMYQRNVAVLASSIGGSLIDRRKKAIMITNSAFDCILQEVAVRTASDIEDCRLLIPQELRDFLLAPEEYRERLEERRKRFVVFQGDFPLLDELSCDVVARGSESELTYGAFAMGEPFIAEGAQADKVIKQLDSRLNFLSGQDVGIVDRLQGVAAYYDPQTPIIVGAVRVIKDPKTERLESGEILVAPSTTPDYTDAIRRCKAIITDWGGQTSHAAIVSRELKKACIIGTIYASQVLRNGQRIKLYFPQGAVEVVEEV